MDEDPLGLAIAGLTMATVMLMPLGRTFFDKAAKAKNRAAKSFWTAALLLSMLGPIAGIFLLAGHILRQQ